MTPEILYLDNHLLVVSKPAGMLSQGDRTGDEDVLTWGKAWLKDRFDKPGAVFLGLVHRLDRPVSGVMVMARTSKAAARLGEQLRQRTVDKRYLAVVQGRLSGRGSFRDLILKQDEQVRIAQPGERGAREAVMHYEALDHHDGLTLVAVRIETGRAHQIRVQFAQRNLTILGDTRYGARKSLEGRSLALHCARMGVEHPTRREPMAWTAPPPDVWPSVLMPAVGEWLEGL